MKKAIPLTKAFDYVQCGHISVFCKWHCPLCGSENQLLIFPEDYLSSNIRRCDCEKCCATIRVRC